MEVDISYYIRSLRNSTERLSNFAELTNEDYDSVTSTALNALSGINECIEYDEPNQNLLSMANRAVLNFNDKVNEARKVSKSFKRMISGNGLLAETGNTVMKINESISKKFEKNFKVYKNHEKISLKKLNKRVKKKKDDGEFRKLIFEVARDQNIPLDEARNRLSEIKEKKKYKHLKIPKDEFSIFEIKTGYVEPKHFTDIRSIDDRIERSKDIDLIGEKKIPEDKNIHTTFLEEECFGDILPVLHEQRIYRLNNLESVYFAVIDNPGQTVGCKFLEKTYAFYVGGFNSTLSPLELEMADITEELGIKIITDSNHPSCGEYDNVIVIKTLLDSPFAQDFIDFSSNEARIIYTSSPSKHEEYSRIMSTSIENSRLERNMVWKSCFKNTTLAIYIAQKIGSIGLSWSEKRYLTGISAAQLIGLQPIMNLTYSESGNTLIGKYEDGTPYIIIGKDSYAASKALMENDIGHALSEEQVKMAFGIDYGIRIENIYFVEQAGNFHLDMCMAIIGQNPDNGKPIITVNHSGNAAALIEEDYEHWLAEKYPLSVRDLTTGKMIKLDEFMYETNKGFRKKARLAQEDLIEFKNSLEEIAVDDLENCGFEVVRVPGNFTYVDAGLKEHHVMNFFNMVTATTPDGQPIIITTYCNENFQKKFKNLIEFGFRGRTPPEIYFLSEEASLQCLTNHGGISCRTKNIPYVSKDSVSSEESTGS